MSYLSFIKKKKKSIIFENIMEINQITNIFIDENFYKKKILKL